jgi:hypothetical protein
VGQERFHNNWLSALLDLIYDNIHVSIFGPTFLSLEDYEEIQRVSIRNQTCQA